MKMIGVFNDWGLLAIVFGWLGIAALPDVSPQFLVGYFFGSLLYYLGWRR